MHGKLKRILLFTMAGLFVLPSFLNVVLPPALASAAPESNPSDQLEKWLYYRGMRACLQSPDFDGTIPAHDNRTISVSDLEEVGLQEHNNKEGFGYLGKDMDNDDSNDGTVKCNDGSIWVRGANLFGFGTVKNLVCAMNEAADQLGDGGRISPKPDVPPCVENATEFELDGGGGSIWQQMLTKALEDPISSKYGGDGNRPSFRFDENSGPDYTYKSMLYLLGKNSLETFCGGSLSSAQPTDNYDGSDQGVSVYIVESDGTIKESGVGESGFSHTYVVTKKENESDDVSDVYYKSGGNDNEADDRSCADMARWTREGARDYATWVRAHPDEAQQNEMPSGAGSDNPSGEEETSCTIDGIGWIICPVVRFVASTTDASYTVVSAMLAVQPLNTNGNSDTYKAWEVMRNIANICFVIAFLIIIYSQMTGAGVTNYGIKKMLPKLIVAAILVNVSYWICAIAVDLSNIIGTAIKDLIDGLNSGLLNEDAQQGNGTWTKLAAVVLVAGVALLVGLSAFLPMVILAVMAIVTVLLVLTLRQGLIILLIVIAPLAFVAYLLPNTEQWFKKWMGLFQILLMMFPIISLIFAASSLAGTIIGNSANDVENEGIKIALQSMAAGVTIIPLFITPIVLKAAGGMLGKVGAFVNNPNRGPFDRMRKGAGAYRDRRKNLMQSRRVGVARDIVGGNGRVLGAAGSRRRRTAAWVGGLGATRSVTNAEKDKYAKASADSSNRNYVADRTANDRAYATKLANGDEELSSLVQAYGRQAVHDEDEKDVKAQQELLKGHSNSALFDRLRDESASRSERAAAARLIAEKGGHQHVQQAYDYLMQQGASGTDANIGGVQELSAEALLRRKPAGVGASQANEMRSGTMQGSGYLDSFASRIEDGKFGAQDIAGMDLDDHIRIAELAASGRLSDTALQTLSSQLAEIDASDTMKLTPEQQRILSGATTRQAATRPDGSGYNLTPL